MALRTYKIGVYKIYKRYLNVTRLGFTISNKRNDFKKLKEFQTKDNLIYYEDPDKFGTLSGQFNTLTSNLEDDSDLKEDNYLNNKPLPTQKLTTKQYADLIKQYLKHKQLKEALDVLEVRMLTEDRVAPENYIYNILIGACADVGYTKKAFKLYNDMKRRALKVTGDTYTCLFNACANSPWNADGLKNAHHLKELMVEKGVNPNITNYNAMIKAFGRCGDMSTAFQIVDEMKSKGIKIRVHTINFLLQACISDKNIGLRHALLVWRKMLLMREKPNIYSFNLMLKCVNDCNLGSKQDIEDLIDFINRNLIMDKEVHQKQLGKQESITTLKLTDNGNTKHNDSPSNLLQKLGQSDLVNTQVTIAPNLLSKIPNMQQVLNLKEVTTAQEKFAVVGHEIGFLKEMESYSVKPNIKTFTQMLPLLENNTETENSLISIMKHYDIKTDISFYNMLIKKRCLRSDYEGALAVKDMINEENKLRKKKHPLKKKLQIKCNVMTYGVLAMACKNKENAENLIQDMKTENLRVNAEILGTLLRQGTAHNNFGYVLYIMNLVRKEQIQINKMFLYHLEVFNEKCKATIQEAEEGKRKCSDVYMKMYQIYINAYQKWLQDVNVEQALKVDHPWEQFRKDIPKPLQRQNLIKEPKRFYKKKFKFVKPYSVKTV